MNEKEIDLRSFAINMAQEKSTTIEDLIVNAEKIYEYISKSNNYELEQEYKKAQRVGNS